MAALLRRRQPTPRVIDFALGRTSLAAVAGEVMSLLRDPEQGVVINVTGFDYFDEQELTALNDLATWSARVQVIGLDSYADQLLPAPTTIDVRPLAERAVTHLAGVTVLTAIIDGRPLDDHELDAALGLARTGGRPIVTVDLRHLERLSPAQILSLAETSGELYRDLGTLILVNTTSHVAEQLRNAGLSGAVRMRVDELL